MKDALADLRLGTSEQTPLPPGEGWGEGVVGAQFIAPQAGLDESSPYKYPLIPAFSRREKEKDGCSESPLGDLQSGFQDFILQRNDRVLTRVESTATLSAERRLDIYYHAYRLRLIDVLADTFERVALYIGEESFEAAAAAYVEQHPSGTRNLRDYGTAFPAFLARYFTDDPEVAELAEMDIRLRYTFDGTDADPLRVADLGAIQPHEWDGVIFTLHPTASFQTFHWNTTAIWQHVSNEQTPPAATALDAPIPWLFWRKELQPHFRSLSRDEHAALLAIRDGKTFGSICAALAEASPELDVTTQIGIWLRTWLDDGVLGRMSVEDDRTR